MSRDPRQSIIPFLNDETEHATIYHALGVEPVINCRGTFTIIGGSMERPETLRAMEAATKYFAQYDELAAAVGTHLGKLTGAEYGLIASGCAAAMKHVTMACVTGGNPEKLINVPDLSGFERTEVIVPRGHRNHYDQALRVVGVDIVMVDDAEQLERAIGPRTAMIYLFTGPSTDPGQPLSLETVAKIAKPHGIPILADAAAEVLTIPNVHLAQGADVVTYSGGKAICGPQAAGIALGRKDLLLAAWQASAPHHGPGRTDKVGKEEILGMLAAVEAWLTRDHDGEWTTWMGRLEQMAEGVAGIDSVTTSIHEPTALSNRAPNLTISWDPAVLHITGQAVAEDMARKPPRVAVGDSDGDGVASIRINPSQMHDEQVPVVIERVRGLLTAQRAPAADMEAPAADLSGEWEVTIRYAVSSTTHLWSLRQEAHWIHGRHESDHSVQDIRGTLEGDRLALRSDARRPGDNIPFMFGGTLAGEVLSGTLNLGEYQMATFEARRRAAPERARVAIPAGPPMAT